MSETVEREQEIGKIREEVKEESKEEGIEIYNLGVLDTETDKNKNPIENLSISSLKSGT